ncbi:MAG: hypothetical protein ABF328_03495 [Akkermansiaceae bacterium]
MKKITFIAVATIFTNSLFAQQNYDMNTINQLVQDLKAEQLHVVETALDVAARKESQKFLELENKCKTDWDDIIDNFEAIEGGEEAQRLVVSALQALDAGDYMSAIEKLVTRFEAGTVDKAIMHEVLNPEGRMRAFLADNHAHARVTAALNKIKIKVGDDADMKTQIDDLLSGETKIGFDEIREDFAGTGYGNIPTITLAD